MQAFQLRDQRFFFFLMLFVIRDVAPKIPPQNTRRFPAENATGGVTFLMDSFFLSLRNEDLWFSILILLFWAWRL